MQEIDTHNLHLSTWAHPRKGLTMESEWEPNPLLVKTSGDFQGHDVHHERQVERKTWFRARIIDRIRSKLGRCPPIYHSPGPISQEHKSAEVYQRPSFNISSLFLPHQRENFKASKKQPQVEWPYMINSNTSAADVVDSNREVDSFEGWNDTGSLLRSPSTNADDMNSLALPATPPRTPNRREDDASDSRITGDCIMHDSASSTASRQSIGAMMIREMKELDEIRQGVGARKTTAGETCIARRDSTMLAAVYSTPCEGSVMSRNRPIRRQKNRHISKSPERSDSPILGSCERGETALSGAASPEPLCTCETCADETTASYSKRTTANPSTRLERLEAFKKAMTTQRDEVEDAIRHVSNSSKNSSIDAQDNTLQQFHERLHFIRYDEHRAGVAVARARKIQDEQRNGDGEGLWIRRVVS